MKMLVKQSKPKTPTRATFVGLLFLIVIVLIAINPAKYSAVAFKGLEVWAKVLVPSLLPFFVLTKLLSATGAIDGVCTLFAPITTKFYKCPQKSSYVFFMSIITGYPVGSKLVADLYNSNQISKTDAIKMTSFCSTSGPMFILGTVGIGMFANAKIGYIILLSHILGAITNGLFYRNIKQANNTTLTNQPTQTKTNHTQSTQKTITTNSFNFSQSIMASVESLLLIGGVICFTFVLLEVLTSNALFVSFANLLNKCGLNANLLTAIICGLGEITKGCLMLSSTIVNSNIACLICTFLISFGGIATFLQAYAFLKSVVPAKIFLLQKLTHAICSTIICLILTTIITI